jgi:hypothetical protein
MCHKVFIVILGVVTAIDETHTPDFMTKYEKEKIKKDEIESKAVSIVQSKTVSGAASEKSIDLKSEELNELIIDDTIDQVKARYHQKVEQYQAGDIIGSLNGGKQQPKKVTAICKTDCILLEIE